jgi:hypothetical protein
VETDRRRYARVAGRWLLTVAVGVVLGLMAHQAASAWRRHRPAEEAAGQAAIIRSRVLLGCYAMRLREFAGAIERFCHAELGDRAQLKLMAGSTLRPAIENFNESFVQINLARFGLEYQLVRSFDDAPRSAALVCQMQRAPNYQWQEMRPLLNTVLVNIIHAWGQDGSEQTLLDIRRQQKTDWLRLRDILLEGARQFGDGAIGQSCRAATDAAGDGPTDRENPSY